MSKLQATAFTSDREADYSVSFRGDVTLAHAHGRVTVEVTDKGRRAYFVLPDKLFRELFKLPDDGVRILAPKPKVEDDDDFDFG